jgi:hypothetical protein
MPKIVFKKVYVLGEQYLLEQHLIRTKDGEDAVPKSICFETDNQKHAFTCLIARTLRYRQSSMIGVKG